MLDGRPEDPRVENPRVENPADLYSFPSSSGPPDDGSGSETGSDSEDESSKNTQAEMIQSLSGNVPQVSVNNEDTLKRMEKPPDLKEMGSSSYNFKCT